MHQLLPPLVLFPEVLISPLQHYEACAAGSVTACAELIVVLWAAVADGCKFKPTSSNGGRGEVELWSP